MTPASATHLVDSHKQQQAREPVRSWLADVLLHIREEYHDMPGLCLTLPQARRLWALDDATCELALVALVEDGYLQPSQCGYVRA